MKKLVFLAILSSTVTMAFTQQLTLDELFKFCKKEPEEINNALEKKNWFYNGRTYHEGDDFIQFDEPVTSVSWTFNLNNRNDNSRWTHTLIYYEYFEFKDGKSQYDKWELSDVEIRKRITLMTHSKADYDLIRKLIEQKFRKTTDTLLDEMALKVYDGISSWIMIGYGTERPTLYNITLRAKSGK